VPAGELPLRGQALARPEPPGRDVGGDAVGDTPVVVHENPLIALRAKILLHREVGPT
jgi:hypothetical protein